ncbi:unnamed protein product [Bursaphelenchus xylophilus]|uniref:(pine wood nematode) hypothetical protein n=1 Tax=Bursaphelenchus xylophilus TaxID=6326 RepID=A0A7I8WVU6_BURXY|nr:unnamed protein product [Bursaphelenchus xylophilus]CAG9117709.1 unnamed protein product [Bursaphelenchus xylophilus]
MEYTSYKSLRTMILKAVDQKPDISIDELRKFQSYETQLENVNLENSQERPVSSEVNELKKYHSQPEHTHSLPLSSNPSNTRKCYRCNGPRAHECLKNSIKGSFSKGKANINVVESYAQTMVPQYTENFEEELGQGTETLQIAQQGKEDEAQILQIAQQGKEDEPQILQIAQQGKEDEAQILQIAQQGKEDEPQILQIAQQGKEDETQILQIAQQGKEDETQILQIAQQGKENEPQVLQIAQQGKEDEPQVLQIAQQGKEEDTNILQIAKQGKEEDTNILQIAKQGKEEDTNILQIAKQGKEEDTKILQIARQGKEEATKILQIEKQGKEDDTQIKCMFNSSKGRCYTDPLRFNTEEGRCYTDPSQFNSIRRRCFTDLLDDKVQLSLSIGHDLQIMQSQIPQRIKELPKNSPFKNPDPCPCSENSVKDTSVGHNSVNGFLKIMKEHFEPIQGASPHFFTKGETVAIQLVTGKQVTGKLIQFMLQSHTVHSMAKIQDQVHTRHLIQVRKHVHEDYEEMIDGLDTPPQTSPPSSEHSRPLSTSSSSRTRTKCQEASGLRTSTLQPPIQALILLYKGRCRVPRRKQRLLYWHSVSLEDSRTSEEK